MNSQFGSSMTEGIAMGTMRTSNYLIYCFLPEQDEYYIIHSYTGAVDQVTPSVVRYLLDHKDPNHTFHTKDEEIVRASLRGRPYVLPHQDTLRALAARGYLTEKSSVEERTYIQHLADFLHDKAVKRSGAGFIVIPTYECNLRCPYCFEAETRVDLKRHGCLDSVMSPQMADAMFKCMDKLLERDIEGAKSIADAKRGMDICLYGGDPLTDLTKPIIEYIVPKGIEQGMRFSAITNGLELDRFTALLGPESIRWLQITLDGPKDIHDRNRIGPSYRGTYETILSHIELALDRQITVSVRLHVNWKTVHRVDEVMNDIEARGFFERKNFGIYAATTHSWHRGHAVPAYPDMATHEVHSEFEKRVPCRSHVQRLDVENDRTPAKLSAYIQHGLTGIWKSMEYCHATTGMCIFDPFGKIYSCWDAVGRSGQEIGEYSAEGPTFNKMAALWRSRSPGKIPECSDCKYAFFHFGGCAAIPLTTQGNILAPGCYEYESDFITMAKQFFRQHKGADVDVIDSPGTPGEGGQRQALVQIQLPAAVEPLPEASYSRT
jgi:uncharacterized protein